MGQSNRFYLGSLFLFFLIFYFPVVHYTYLYHDDFRMPGAPIFPDRCVQHPHTRNLFSYGRPLGAWVHCWVSSQITRVDEARWFRLVSVGALFVSAWLCFRFLIARGFTPLWAWFASSSSFILPGFLKAAFEVTGLGLSLSALLAVVAGTLVTSGTQWWYRVSGGIFLILSLCIHQSTAMLFWSMVSVHLLLSHTQGMKQHWPVFAVGLAAMAFYFVGYRASGSHAGLQTLAPERFLLERDVMSKVSWLFEQGMPVVFNLWNIYPKLWIAFLLVVALSVGLYKAGQNTVLATLAWMLSFTPHLVVVEKSLVFRSFVAPSLAVWLALNSLLLSREWMTRGWRRCTGYVFIVVWGLSVWISYRHLTRRMVRPSHEELSFTVRELGKRDYVPEMQIPIVYPSWGESPIHDEFGVPTSAFAQDLGLLVAWGFRELGHTNVQFRVTPIESTQLELDVNVVNGIDYRILMRKGSWCFPDLIRRKESCFK